MKLILSLLYTYRGKRCHVLIGVDVPFYELCTRYTHKNDKQSFSLLLTG